MIKAKGTMPDGRPIFILGLSRGNMDNLLKGKPIHIDLTEMGAHTSGAILLMGGETEVEITHELQKVVDLPKPETPEKH